MDSNGSSKTESYSLQLVTGIVYVALFWMSLLAIVGESAQPPNGQLFWLLALFVAAVVCGVVVEVSRGPPLLGMLVAGFILRNTSPIIIDANVSTVLRNVALAIILLRAGFGLDPQALAKLSYVCGRLAILPTTIETIAIAIAAYLFLSFPIKWGLLLGFVVASVSPAVVVPSIIALSERNYGVKKGIPTLTIAASSIDNAYCITAFGVMIGMVYAGNTPFVWQLFKGPIQAILGLVIGAFIGVFLWFVPRDNSTFHNWLPVGVDYQRISLSVLYGIAVVFVSRNLDWSGVGPVGVLTLSFVATLRWRPNGLVPFIERGLKFVWFFCQPFLFALIGAAVDLSNVKTDSIVKIIIVLLIGVAIRCVTATIVVWGANLTFKEKVFVAISWLPKATVQAAVGPVALDMATQLHDEQGMDFGLTVLNAAVLSIVLTAPLGAILLAITGPKLLTKDDETANGPSTVPEPSEITPVVANSVPKV